MIIDIENIDFINSHKNPDKFPQITIRFYFGHILLSLFLLQFKTLFRIQNKRIKCQRSLFICIVAIIWSNWNQTKSRKNSLTLRREYSKLFNAWLIMHELINHYRYKNLKARLNSIFSHRQIVQSVLRTFAMHNDK